MLDAITTVIRFRNKAKAYRAEGELFLREYIESHHPHYNRELARWQRSSRNANIIAFTSVIGEALCGLEGITYDERRKHISFYSGAVARTSDDLLDNGDASPLEASVFQHSDNVRLDRIGLLYAFEAGLVEALPPHFLDAFVNVITHYNESQADSVSQKLDISNQQIIDIRDRTGGYAGLLLYSCIFPENGDLSLHVTGSYSPSGELPANKGEALFNLGAWFNRVDDFCDWLEDSQSGTKQLVTKNIITWSSLKAEAQYVFAGLALYYPEKNLHDLEISLKVFTNPLFIISRSFTYFRDQLQLYRTKAST